MALLVKRNISQEHVEIFRVDYIENTVVSVNMSNGSNIVVVSVYIPPNNALREDGLDVMFATNNKIIVGDFEAHLVEFTCQQCEGESSSWTCRCQIYNLQEKMYRVSMSNNGNGSGAQ